MQKLLAGRSTVPVQVLLTGAEGDTAEGLLGVLAAVGSALAKQVVVTDVPKTLRPWTSTANG